MALLYSFCLAQCGSCLTIFHLQTFILGSWDNTTSTRRNAKSNHHESTLYPELPLTCYTLLYPIIDLLCSNIFRKPLLIIGDWNNNIFQGMIRFMAFMIYDVPYQVRPGYDPNRNLNLSYFCVRTMTTPTMTGKDKFKSHLFNEGEMWGKKWPNWLIMYTFTSP